MKNSHSLINADEEDQVSNPMDGLANLADVMLVLAVGIMLALIINWNVDISTTSSQTTQQQVDTQDALEFTDDQIEQASDSDDPDQQNLTQLGAVYYDKETGKYYIVGNDSQEELN